MAYRTTRYSRFACLIDTKAPVASRGGAHLLSRHRMDSCSQKTAICGRPGSGLLPVVLLIALFAVGEFPVVAQESVTPQAQRESTQGQQPAAQPPITVNVLPAPKTEEQIKQETEERIEKANLDRRLVDLTADLSKYTAGLFA